MVRRIVLARICLVLGIFGIFIGFDSAAATSVCQSSTAVITISQPTTLTGLQLTGQTLRVAAPLEIQGTLGGCAARLELSGGSIHAAAIELEAGSIRLDGGSLTTSGPLRLSSASIILRDSVESALILASGDSLALTGTTLLDLRMLRHRDSLISAVGDLTFRSAQPIHGDAHYVAGGSIRAETLDGGLAAMISPEDPIILARGDVTLGNYSGASLHIIAGGSVQLGSVIIMGSDTVGNSINPSNTTTYNASTPISTLASVLLSNGNTIQIYGNSQPTLDVRAGVNWSLLGGLPTDRVIPVGSVSPTFFPTPTSAAITVASISCFTTNSQILLTNQYQPNTALTGNIVVTNNINLTFGGSAFDVGDVFIDSRGGVQTNAIQTFTNTAINSGNGGDISIFATAGSISTGQLNSSTTSSGDDTKAGGNITLQSRQNSVQFASITTNSTTTAGRSGNAGSVTISAGTALLGNSTITTMSTGEFGSGAGGNVTITTNGALNVGAIVTASRFNGVGSTGSGAGGAINLLARNAGALDGGSPITILQIFTDSGALFAATPDTGSSSNGGAVNIRSEDGSITVTDFIRTSTFARGGASHAGNGGAVNISTPNGSIAVGNFGIETSSRTFQSTGNAGRGGDVTLIASHNVTVNALVSISIDTSSVATTGNSNSGGNVLIRANSGAITIPNSPISTSTESSASTGNAGNVTLIAAPTISGTLTMDGVLAMSSATGASGSSGNGGRINLIAGGAITMTDQLQTQTFSSNGLTGNGGDIIIASQGSIIAGATIHINTSSYSYNGAGDGGNLMIDAFGSTTLGVIINGSRFDTDGYSGDAGDVFLTLRNQGSADGADDLTLGYILGDSGSSYASGNGLGSSGDGGDITIAVEDGDLVVQQWLWAISGARGSGASSGNGGNIDVTASGGIQFGDFGIFTETRVFSGLKTGNGGNVTLRAGADIVQQTASSFAAVGTSAALSGGNGTTGNGGTILIESTNGSILFESRQTISQVNSSNGQAGNAGSITLSVPATQTITIGTVDASTIGLSGSGNGGTIAITGGTVTTTRLDSSTGSSNGPTGAAGAIMLETHHFPYTQTLILANSIARNGTGGGGDISITTTGPLQLASLQATSRVSGIGIVGPAGSISVLVQNAGALDGTDSLTVANAIFADSVVTSGVAVASSDGGGDVTLQVDDGSIVLNGGFISITTPSISRGPTHHAAGAGDIHLVAPRGSILLAGAPQAFSQANGGGTAGQGGAISIKARDNVVITGNATISADSSSSTGANQGGGPITIETGGTINAPLTTLNARAVATSGATGIGGTMTIDAGGPINLGSLNANAQRSTGLGNLAGIIQITTPQTLTIASIQANSSGTPAGAAGSVVLDGKRVRLTDPVPTSSISTLGLANTGVISITHGGAGVLPFVVGDASLNGSAKRLVSSSTAINPSNSFLYNHTQAPNIHIRSVMPPALTLVKTVAPLDLVDYHGSLTYTVVVANTSSAASNVAVSDPLPSNTTFARWVTQPAGATATNNLVTWNGALETGANVVLTFVVTHTGAPSDIVTNTAFLTHTASFFTANATVTSFVEAPLSVDAGVPQAINEGSLVNLQGSASATPAAIHWDFGDGTSVGGALSVVHTYADNGVYTATLTISTTSGLASSDSVVMTVQNVAPTVEAGSHQTLPPVVGGTPVQFNGSFSDPSTADSHTIHWDFGDGNTATNNLTPTHTYANPGVYLVHLTVTDDDGASNDDTLTVTIEQGRWSVFIPFVVK